MRRLVGTAVSADAVLFLFARHHGGYFGNFVHFHLDYCIHFFLLVRIVVIFFFFLIVRESSLMVVVAVMLE